MCDCKNVKPCEEHPGTYMTRKVVHDLFNLARRLPPEMVTARQLVNLTAETVSTGKGIGMSTVVDFYEKRGFLPSEIALIIFGTCIGSDMVITSYTLRQRIKLITEYVWCKITGKPMKWEKKNEQ